MGVQQPSLTGCIHYCPQLSFTEFAGFSGKDCFPCNYPSSRIAQSSPQWNSKYPVWYILQVCLFFGSQGLNLKYPPRRVHYSPFPMETVKALEAARLFKSWWLEKRDKTPKKQNQRRMLGMGPKYCKTCPQTLLTTLPIYLLCNELNFQMTKAPTG